MGHIPEHSRHKDPFKRGEKPDAGVYRSSTGGIVTSGDCPMPFVEAPVDTRKWGWMEPDGEHADGPFPTREDALADAHQCAGIGTKILLGRVEWAKPCDYVEAICCGSDDALERLDEYACDDQGFASDNPIFDLKADVKKHEADAELRESLMQWIEKHVASNYWWLEDTEQVVLADEHKGAQ